MIIDRFLPNPMGGFFISRSCSCGGTGIHDRLKICCPIGLASSSLAGSMVIKGGIMKTEKCVNCKEDTGVLVNEHIDKRHCYVEGVGQLCKDCWNKIYFDVRSWSVK